jgi:hypothetical protein
MVDTPASGILLARHLSGTHLDLQLSLALRDDCYRAHPPTRHSSTRRTRRYAMGAPISVCALLWIDPPQVGLPPLVAAVSNAGGLVRK